MIEEVSYPYLQRNSMKILKIFSFASLCLLSNIAISASDKSSSSSSSSSSGSSSSSSFFGNAYNNAYNYVTQFFSGSSANTAQVPQTSSSSSSSSAANADAIQKKAKSAGNNEKPSLSLRQQLLANDWFPRPAKPTIDDSGDIFEAENFHVRFDLHGGPEVLRAVEVINFSTNKEKYDMYQHILNTFWANNAHLYKNSNNKNRVDTMLYYLQKKIKAEKHFTTAQLQTLKTLFDIVLATKDMNLSEEQKAEILRANSLTSFNFIADKIKFRDEFGDDSMAYIQALEKWKTQKQQQIKLANEKDPVPTE